MMGFIFGSILMWQYPGNVPSSPKQSLNFQKKTGSSFEMLRTLFIRCMSALVFSPRIGKVTVSATIIGTYVLFSYGICTAHFPSIGIEVPL